MESHKKKDVPILNAIKDRFETYYSGRFKIMCEYFENIENDKTNGSTLNELLSEHERHSKIDLFDSISELIYKDFIDREDRFKRTETE